MLALIDGDILQYVYGSATDEAGRPVQWPFIQTRVQGHIDRILHATGADSYQIFLTSDDKSNFRYKVATIKPYKGHRKTEKPYWYHHIRNFLVDHRGAVEVHGREADDVMAEVQWADYKETVLGCGETYEEHGAWLDTIICTIDKDLDMVPGWHYKWPHGDVEAEGPYYVSELDGLKFFYCQCLTGDTADNIPGLFGVGKSSKLLDRVRSCSSEYDMYCTVREEYEKRFGSYADQFLKENADLLWMRRGEDDEWVPPSANE